MNNVNQIFIVLGFAYLPLMVGLQLLDYTPMIVDCLILVIFLCLGSVILNYSSVLKPVRLKITLPFIIVGLFIGLIVNYMDSHSKLESNVFAVMMLLPPGLMTLYIKHLIESERR